MTEARLLEAVIKARDARGDVSLVTIDGRVFVHGSMMDQDMVRIQKLVKSLRTIITLADDAAMHDRPDAMRLIVEECHRALDT